MLSQLDVELHSLFQSAVFTDGDAKAVAAGQYLFLVPIKQSSE